MIIQNTNTSQAAQPAIHVGTDAPKAVTNASNTSSPDPTLGVVDAKQSAPSHEQLKNAVDVINQVMRQSNNSLQFSLDSTTKIPVVKLVDTQTGELIRQYPSKETLAISRSIDQFQQQQGLLLTQKA